MGLCNKANWLAMAEVIYFLTIYQHWWLKITVGKIQWHLRCEAVTFSDTSMAFTKNWGGQESFNRNTVPTVFPRPLGFTQNWTEILPLAVLFSSKQLPAASGALKVCLHILHHCRVQSYTSHILSFSTFSLSHSKPHSLTYWKKMIIHTDRVIEPRLSSVSKEPYGRYYYRTQKGKWQAWCAALTFWWWNVSEKNITSVEWKSVQLNK